MSLNSLGKLELTFAILKPHITAVPHYIQVFSDILVLRCNSSEIITTEDASSGFRWQNQVWEKTSKNGPCYFHVLARENAIQLWRKMMGPTKVFKTIFTHPDSIRGKYGLSDTRNATHGSDSPESFEKEVKIFFPEFNLTEWFEKEEMKFSKGESKFDELKLVHVT